MGAFSHSRDGPIGPLDGWAETVHRVNLHQASRESGNQDGSGGMMKGRAKFAALLVAGALLAAGCGGGSGGSGGGDKLTLVAYSTPREAYEALIPGFQKTDAGKGVSFSQSYGGSGEPGPAGHSGRGARACAVSPEPDMTKLVEDGLVA